MLKILSMWYEYSNMVGMESLHHLEQEINKLSEFKRARKYYTGYRVDPHTTIQRVMPDADWVIWSGLGYQPPKKRDYKIALFMTDLHCSRSLKLRPRDLIKRVNKAGFDAFLMSYTQLARETVDLKARTKEIDPEIYMKNLNAPIFHLASSMNPKIFHPTDEPKKYEAVFLASTHRTVYKFRWHIKNELPELAKANNWRVLIKGRPPGKHGKRRTSAMIKQGYIVGKVYARTLASSKVFIFGLGVYKYPCLKFVEGMASGTCVMSDPPLTAKEMHYIPNWNFVNINLKNWKRKLKYYLTHDREREAIAKNGYDTFLKYHTSEIRAKQLVKFLEANK